ncbi:MAG: cytochrome-c peroxidase [Gemmatimonadetes bacterium]|nr:MAG: cytochrome-c peroxidase [Gemmatimonadota bacterium]
MTRTVRTICLGLLGLVAGCDGLTPPQTLPPPLDSQLRETLSRVGAIPIGPMPVQDPALVDLGQALVFDKILSGNRDIACATCHLPSQHAADGLSLAIGTGGSGAGPSRSLGPGRQFVPRNAPSLLNGGLGLFYLFWDGQVARSGFGPLPPGQDGGGFVTPAGTLLPAVPNILAAQAMFPVANRREMRGERGDLDAFGNPNELAQYGDSQFVEIWQAIMQRLLALDAYKAKFAAAFPGTLASQLGFQHAATAIAAFEMQAFTKTDSPFDRYLNRDDAALTTAEKRGALLFFGKAQCSSCHSGPFLGGGSFANAGVPQLGPGTGGGAPLDLGRGGLKDQSFYKFAFRVTPLRNVELTAPYMHDGAFPTLEAVVRHYNDVTLALRTYDVAQLAPELRPLYHGDVATINTVLETLDFRLRRSLGLTDDEQRDLVAFLKSLTDPAARDLSALIPAAVPSGLPVGP